MNTAQTGSVSRMTMELDHMIAALNDLNRDEYKRRDNNYNSPKEKAKAAANIQALDSASNCLFVAFRSLLSILENEGEGIR